MSEKKIRTFIAIRLPEETKDFLGKLQDILKISDADVKWVKKENIHLTLKFLGEIEKKKIDEIIKIIDNLSNSISVFQLEVSEIGAFPKKEYPRVIWAGLVSGDKEMRQIAKELDNAICKIGLPKESRSFSSHITLGRVRSSLNKKQLIEQLNYLEGNFPKPKPKCKVDKITLLKSTLTPSGPIYEVLHERNLKTN